MPVQAAAVPVVSSLSPASGTIGAEVTIAGSGFAGATGVTFGTAASEFTVDSASKITATVPAGASTGPVAVTGPGGTASTTKTFTVTPGIALSAVSGPPTTTVTVSGAGFGTDEAVDIYFGTTDEALASTSSTGNFAGIAVQVPATAVPGTAYLTAVGRHSGLSAQAQFSVSTSWVQFRYSGKHEGFNPYENVLSASNVSGIDVAWSFTTESGVYSSPAVVGGVVYVGSQNGNVYALSAATGAKVWSFQTDGSVSSSPAVADGVVYVGSEDGNVYALGAVTGAKVWSFPTGGNVLSSPAVADGVVYIGSFDQSVYALSAATGAKVWSFPTGGGIQSSPAVADGVVYVGSADNNVYALSADGGAELWSFTAGGQIYAPPAVADGVVYVGSNDNNMYSFALAGGA
jgi:outer membrane protein assembly factor BamB